MRISESLLYQYEMIEAAARGKKPVIFNSSIAEKLQTFPLLIMVATDKFLVKDLYWRKNDEIYRAFVRIMPSSSGLPAMYVAGNLSLNGFCSGKTDMFCPENRYVVCENEVEKNGGNISEKICQS